MLSTNDDALALVWEYANAEDAKDAAERLAAHGVSGRIDGGSRIGPARVLAPQSQVDRARAILHLPSVEARSGEKAPHRCPGCGAGDPRWLGKWKGLLLMISIVGISIVAVVRPAWLGWTIGVVGATFVLALFLIPEFQCRQCRRTWSK